MNKKRNLLLTILVFTAVFLINKLTGDIFNGITDIHVSEFLCEFKSAALAIMGAVILKKMWIYQRFDTDLLKKSWATGLFDVILSIYSYLNYYAGTRQGITAKPVVLLVFILTMICVGIYEETMFRGLLQNGFHEFFGEDTVEHVILSVIFAGVCFGALHLTNAFRPGVSLSDAVPQAIAACGAGIFYGAVYFRTGKNLWYNVLIHGFHDAIIFIMQGSLNGTIASNVISQASKNSSMQSVFFQSAAYVAVGLFLLRKKKVEPLLKKM